MLRIAFPIIGNKDWYGGISYLDNLLFSIKSYKKKRISIYIICGYFTNRSFVDLYRQYGDIIYTFKLDIFPIRFVFSIFEYCYQRVTKIKYIDKLLSSYKIDIVSHESLFLNPEKIKIIGWIPDFQHVHYPEYFPNNEIINRNKSYLKTVLNSNRVILLSTNALKEYNHLFPIYKDKARVLHFVSKIDSDVYKNNINGLLKKYRIPAKYFIIPNQFWKHKNHSVVFKAVNEAKKKGVLINVICTGYMKDWRNRTYFKELQMYIKNNNLRNQITFLGLVPHADVLSLMRFSVSVINPSLFEGWSTSVEESKSLGKKIILSDIPVHREQRPPGSTYFNPHSYTQLSTILQKNWKKCEGGPDYFLEAKARKKLQSRIKKYADDYKKIIL